jgi:hypothetical protein
VEYDLKKIPDFKKFTLSVNENENSGAGGGAGSHSILVEEELNFRKAVEYLELREDKLVSDFNTSYAVLKEYYEFYLEKESLDRNQIRHILNIEKKSPEKYRLVNLQKC